MRSTTPPRRAVLDELGTRPSLARHSRRALQPIRRIGAIGFVGRPVYGRRRSKALCWERNKLASPPQPDRTTATLRLAAQWYCEQSPSSTMRRSAGGITDMSQHLASFRREEGWKQRRQHGLSQKWRFGKVCQANGAEHEYYVSLMSKAASPVYGIEIRN